MNVPVTLYPDREFCTPTLSENRALKNNAVIDDIKGVHYTMYPEREFHTLDLGSTARPPNSRECHIVDGV